MKFTLLEITNFLTIGQATLQLDDRGLNVIQGVNDDDTSTNNGAGKSSVVDALCWALYSATAREVKGDDVVNDTAKKTPRSCHYRERRHQVPHHPPPQAQRVQECAPCAPPILGWLKSLVGRASSGRPVATLIRQGFPGWPVGEGRQARLFGGA